MLESAHTWHINSDLLGVAMLQQMLGNGIHRNLPKNLRHSLRRPNVLVLPRHIGSERLHREAVDIVGGRHASLANDEVVIRRAVLQRLEDLVRDIGRPCECLIVTGEKPIPQRLAQSSLDRRRIDVVLRRRIQEERRSIPESKCLRQQRQSKRTDKSLGHDVGRCGGGKAVAGCSSAGRAHDGVTCLG